jgi:hypothetical protein
MHKRTKQNASYGGLARKLSTHQVRNSGSKDNFLTKRKQYLTLLS